MDSVTIEAFFLPHPFNGLSYRQLTFENRDIALNLKIPVLTSEIILRILDQIKESRDNYLSQLSIKDIVRCIGESIDLWMDPDFELRTLAEKYLPIITRYSSPMVAHTLEKNLSSLKEDTIWQIIKTEFDDPLVLDEFRLRKLVKGWTRAYGPSISSIIFSGNAPGLPAIALSFVLLVKSACIGKSASGDLLFPALFAKSLAQIDPEIAKALAIVYWEGGRRDIETEIFSHSDLVVGYGNNFTLDDIQKRLPAHVNFLRYGQKFSFSIIGKESVLKTLVPAVIHAATYDVSMYDQQACMSPHIIYVEEGGETSPREFARLLATEMELIQSEFPKGQISESEMVAIQELRSIYEFKSIQNNEIDLYCSKAGTAWTVIYEPTSEFVPSCLNRTIRVLPIDNLKNLITYLIPLRGMIQSIGYSLSQERLLNLAELLVNKLKVSRFAPLGALPHPSSGWHHDGLFNLASMVQWADIETNNGEEN